MRELALLDFQIAGRLALALLLGVAIGAERELRDQPAGLRTHALVSMGSALFGVISVYGFVGYSANPGDPARVAAQVVTGVGFLGAGAILRLGATIRGLTTAASLWVVAAVGLAAGIGLYATSVVATFLTLAMLIVVRVTRDPLRKVFGRGHHSVIVEVEKGGKLTEVLHVLTARPMHLIHVDVDEEGPEGVAIVSALVRLEHGVDVDDLVPALSEIHGVRSVDFAR